MLRPAGRYRLAYVGCLVVAVGYLVRKILARSCEGRCWLYSKDCLIRSSMSMVVAWP